MNKICKHCIHFNAHQPYQDIPIREYRCMRPVRHDINLVTGTNYLPANELCRVERGKKNNCGEEGVHFKPKLRYYLRYK